MSKRDAWTNYLLNRKAAAKGKKLSNHHRLRIAKQEHDALENTCRDIALARYGIELYKADAAAVRVKSKRTGEYIFITRCKSGIPDRIAVIPPTGRFAGFEFKTAEEPELRANQQKVHNEMARSGAAVYTINSVRMFEECLSMLLSVESDKYKHWMEGQP